MPTLYGMVLSNNARPPRFRPDIEGLRAVAVLLVVAYHAHLLNVSGGFIGVDVFFVLSGYLITEILVRQLESAGSIAFQEFYSRRLLRLLPAAALMLVVTLVVACFVYGALERIDIAQSAVATSLYSSNIFFLLRDSNYFAAGAEANPFLHTWSLAVEEQFYFVWPLLLLVGWRMTRSRHRLSVLLAVFVALSFAGEVWLTRKNQPWAFYAMPARAWEFGIGGLAVLLPLRDEFSARAMQVVGWIALAMIVASAMVLTSATPFPGTAVFVPAMGTALLLFAGRLGGPIGTTRLLSVTPLQWLGRHSYSWYLWHWPVLVISAELFPGAPWYARALFVLGSLAVAALTTAVLENPVRFSTFLRARPRMVLSSGILLSVFVAGMAAVMHRDADARGGRYAHAEQDASALTAHQCTADFNDSRPRECAFGDTASVTQVVLFGDSHAAEWFPALDSVSHLHHWRLVTLVKYSCPVAEAHIYNRVLKRGYDECDRWRRSAIRRIAVLHPALIVVGEFPRGQVVVNANGSRVALDAAFWERSLRISLARLDSIGETVLIRDSPAIGLRVPHCLSRADHRGQPASVCAARRDVAVDSVYFHADTRAATGFARVSIRDFSDDICAAATCDPIRDGIVVYRDQNHLSAAFAAHLTPAFDRAFAPLVRRGTPPLASNTNN